MEAKVAGRPGDPLFGCSETAGVPLAGQPGDPLVGSSEAARLQASDWLVSLVIVRLVALRIYVGIPLAGQPHDCEAGCSENVGIPLAGQPGDPEAAGVPSSGWLL